MMKSFVTLLAIIPVASSFAPTSFDSRCCDPCAASPSTLFYTTDNGDGDGSSSIDLSSLTHRGHTPSPLLPIHTPFLSRIKTEAEWKEWQYSFSRNGLTDFLPQFASHLSCLSIDFETGQEAEPTHAISEATERAKTCLPWQYGDYREEASSSIVSVPVSRSSTGDEKGYKLGNVAASSNDSIATKFDGSDYDCILDSGLMNAVISSIPSKVTWHSKTAPTGLLDLVKLINEANQSIREFGIYVAITDASIPDHVKGYLDAMGEVMGLAWNYDLDGVSNDEYCVSVARKHFTGAVNFDINMDNTTRDNGNLLKP